MSIPRASVGLLLVLLAAPAFAAAPPGVLRDLHGDPLPAGVVARLGTVRWRHHEGAARLAFSPDGRYLLGSSGRVLHVWERATGHLVKTIQSTKLEGDLPFTRFAVAAGGQTLVSAGHDGRLVCWWDLASGRLVSSARLAETDEQGRTVADLAVSSDGRRVAVAVSSAWKVVLGHVVLAERADGKVLRQVSFGGEATLQAAFAPDGKSLRALFLMPGKGRLVRQIDFASGGAGEARPLKSSHQAVLSPTLQVGGLGTDGHLWLLLPDGKMQDLRFAPKLAGHSLSFSPDGHTLLASQYGDPHVSLVGTADGKERRVRLPGELILRAQQAVLSPDNKVLALSHSGTTIALLDATTGERLNDLPGLTHCPDVLAFSGDGRSVLTGSEQDGLVRWDAISGRRLLRVPARRADALWRGTGVLTHGGNRLVRTRWRSIEVVDVRTGKVLNDWRVAEKAIGKLVLSADDRTLAALGKDGVVRLWSLPLGRSLGQARPGNAGSNHQRWLQMSADGQILATGEGWFQLDLFAVPSGQQTGQVRQRRDYLGAPWRFTPLGWQGAFAPDGRRVYSSFPHFVQVWDLAFRKEAAPLDEEALAGASGSAPSQMALSADGRFLARVNSQGALSLWETASGRPIHRFEGLWGPVAFTPAGWRLAAADRVSLSVPIWDLPSLFDSPPDRTTTPDQLWSDLAHADATRAQRALWRWSRVDAVVPFLATKLPPVGPADVKRLQAWIADLGDDDFSRREQAERDLADAGDAARDLVEAALRREKDLEIQFRLRRLVEALQGPSPRRLREMRAVLLLEINASPEARRLLGRLAGGLPDATLTREARAALARLGKRPPLSAAAPAP
jgi:WD40 repeat protein